MKMKTKQIKIYWTQQWQFQEEILHAYMKNFERFQMNKLMIHFKVFEKWKQTKTQNSRLK